MSLLQASFVPLRRALVLALGLAVLSGGAQAAPAAVEVSEPWVRPAVAGQGATAAFMQIKAGQASRLVAVRSTVAGVAEIHEMKLDGEVMRMRALPAGLPLPAGASVALTPSGLHIMLMQLKGPLKEGSTVPLTLVFEDARQQRQELTVQAPVRQPVAAGHEHHPGHDHGHGGHKH